MKKAGVFDSGVGGLSVLKSILQENLFEEIIYYGDTARVPYGPKDKNTIIRYALEALEFFKNFDIDILIVACNSVSAYAIEELKKVTDIQVVGVIEPGALALKEKIKNKDAKILITGTKATIKSEKYKKLLQEYGYNHLIEIPTPLFVPLVEENIFEGKVVDSVMELYFNDIKDVDAIILGCTHFPLLEKEYRKNFKKTVLIHSGDAIVKYLKKYHGCKRCLNKTEVSYYASENPDHLKNVAQKWLKL